jgi:hypothetical protein
MIEFMLKDRRVRLIDGVFYARAIRNGIETKNEIWREVSFHETAHGYIQCSLTCGGVEMEMWQHRMVWYAHNQEWDIWDTSRNNSIDHRNQNKKDNRIENLRKATHSENEQNINHKGCFFKKNRNKWYAQIQLNGKRKHIGSYDTYEEAHEAYLQAKRILHPYFVEEEEL